MDTDIDFSTEKAVLLPPAGGKCRALKDVFGYAPTRGSMDYWRNTGLVYLKTGERIFLEVCRSGGALVTSIEAANRFKRALNGGALCPFCKKDACAEMTRISDGKQIPVCVGCKKEAMKWTVAEILVYGAPRYFTGDDDA